MMNFLERDDGNRVGVARFLSVRSENLNAAWVDASRYWIDDVGGERIYAGNLDVVRGRSALSFDQLLIEEYPSRKAAVEVMERSASLVDMGLTDNFVIALKPESRLAHRIIAAIGRTVRTLRPVSVIEVPEIRSPQGIGGLDMSSDQAQIHAFLERDQWEPFAMLNMNSFTRSALYEEPQPSLEGEPGEKAYQRYARNTAFEVFRRGGNFFWIATPIAVLAGESSHPLARQWSQFVVVTWPSRMAFRHMLASGNYQKGESHRSAGLSNSIAIPGTPWINFVRYSL